MIRKTFLTAITVLVALTIKAQTDSMYIMKNGFVVNKLAAGASNIDSIIFYKPLTAKTTINDVDGNTYNVLTLGSQVWMQENLRVTRYNDGTPIELIQVDSIWPNITTPAYSWKDNDSATNALKCGALYNGYVINYGENVCPTGWHLPSISDWEKLIEYLVLSGYNYDGTRIPESGNKIGKALAVPSDQWFPSTNEGAIGNSDYPEKQNATGFSAVPAGLRYFKVFDRSMGWSYWWTSSFYSYEENGVMKSVPLLYYLDYQYSSLQQSNQQRSSGLSIRCVKD